MNVNMILVFCEIIYRIDSHSNMTYIFFLKYHDFFLKKNYISKLAKKKHNVPNKTQLRLKCVYIMRVFLFGKRRKG